MKGHGKKEVSFAAPYPGSIIPLDLTTVNGEILCQKDAFLCAAKGTEVSIAFNKRLGVRLFWWRRIYTSKTKRRWASLSCMQGELLSKKS